MEIFSSKKKEKKDVFPFIQFASEARRERSAVRFWAALKNMRREFASGRNYNSREISRKGTEQEMVAVANCDIIEQKQV